MKIAHEVARPDWKPKHGYVLTVGTTDDGRLLAICSDGSPQYGQKTTILTLEVIENERDAMPWFKRVKREKPWVTRQ